MCAKATASSSGEVGVRRLSQGDLAIQLGGAGDITSSLAVISQPALPPELLPPLDNTVRSQLMEKTQPFYHPDGQ